MPAVALNPQGLIASVAEAVVGAWQRQDRNELMALSPTFSSLPQAVYYGRTILPGRQVLHRSTLMNTFCVFQGVETGTPVMMTGHKFTFHLACPEEPQALWSLEVPYPTDAQMRDVMRRFMPPMVSDAVALTWIICVLTWGSQGMQVQKTLCPHQLNTANLAKLPRGLAMPTPRGLMGSGQEVRQIIVNLEEQLYRRASKELQLGNDYFITHLAEETEDLSMMDTDSRMPDLVSVSSGNEGSNASIDIGFCDLCLAPQHESELVCPLFGAIDAKGSLSRAVLTNKTLDNEGELGVSAVFNKRLGEYEVLGVRVPVEIMCPAPEGSATLSGDVAFQALVDAVVGAREAFATDSFHFACPPVFKTPAVLSDLKIDTATTVVLFSAVAQLAGLPPRRIILQPSGKTGTQSQRNKLKRQHPETGAAVLEGAWGWLSSYLPSCTSNSADPSSTSSESNSGFSCTSRYEFYHNDNSKLHNSFSFWVREGNEHQHDHRHFENEMGVEPLHQVLQALHGPLRFFVGYLAMAGQDADSNPGTEPTCDVPLSPSAALTSLDHSLPSSVEHMTITPANLAYSNGEWEEITVEPLGMGTRKRKHPDGEEGGLNQQGRCKKTLKFHGDSLRRIVIKWEARKATGMADEHAIQLMVGVRLAVLEALRHIEDMCNGCNILANAIHEILSIRLHKDYAISIFFNANSLDENYSERNWEYWHLLSEEHPQSLYLRNFDIDDSSDSGSMGGLEYPPSTTSDAADGTGIGHHEPCRDLDDAGPITLTITLRDNAVPVE
ncbi:hypothetical protein K438DRAFT_2013380 [Mycena galopus ATCC 62051]|nr:hypothetical protein K438DRAFT_2013380 [Mycena galopus ATCC 62051]